MTYFLKDRQRSCLDAHGPSVQRLLLASTSTKNPEYSDLLYVANLLLPLTVNTLPEKTIEAILDHLPQKTQTVSMVDIDQAYKTIQSVKNLGIDLSDVSNKLETEGVNKFKASFDSLLTAIESKRDNS
jgi:transaldolase